MQLVYVYIIYDALLRIINISKLVLSFISVILLPTTVSIMQN